MKVLLQRSGKSVVTVNKKIVGSIESGLVLFVCFTEGDDLEKIKYLINKIINLRIFPDNSGIMNKSIKEYGGSILSISQFTLYADVTKGNRPSYMKALPSTSSVKLYQIFNDELAKYCQVETGVFGADMVVSIENIGPTTIILER